MYVSIISDGLEAMHAMSVPFGNDQQEEVATDGDFITNNNIMISDYDQVRFVSTMIC